MTELQELAEAIRRLNTAGDDIARIIGRPAERSHAGEFIASRVFGIQLHEWAEHRYSDGIFESGPLAGRAVNVKWYGHWGCLLDLHEDVPAGLCHLVLTGSAAQAVSSKGKKSPWNVTYAFLLDTDVLIPALRARGVRIGIATSVPKQLWLDAEVYPSACSPLLRLTDGQKQMLALFH